MTESKATLSLLAGFRQVQFGFVSQCAKELIKTRLPIGNWSFVFALVRRAESQFPVRLQKSLQIPLTLHTGPERYFVEFV